MKIETNYPDKKLNGEMRIRVREEISERYIRKNLSSSDRKIAENQIRQGIQLITEMFGASLARALHHLGAGTNDPGEGIKIIKQGFERIDKELTTLRH